MHYLRLPGKMYTLYCLLAAGFLCSQHLYAQEKNTGTLFYIDSVAIKEEMDPDDHVLLPEEIAVIRPITDKDSISRLGLAGADTVMYILTKAYRDRPDSVKQLPRLQQLILKNNRFYTDTTKAPYNGRFIDYYLNGAKKSFGNIINGQIEGYANVFYPDGSLMESHYYSHNNEDGMREEYYLNGVIKRRGKFTNGLMEGYWQEWYSTGKLKREVYFLHSRPNYPDAEYIFNDDLNAAAAAIRNGQYRNALDALQECHKINPEYDEVYLYMGMAYAGQKKYSKAIESFNRALSIEPMSKDAHLQRAYAYAAQLQEEQAKGKHSLDIGETAARICEDLKAAQQQGDKDARNRLLRKQYCIQG
jgi:tetratricopeptide (TPR) repeat protein